MHNAYKCISNIKYYRMYQNYHIGTRRYERFNPLIYNMYKYKYIK